MGISHPCPAQVEVDRLLKAAALERASLASARDARADASTLSGATVYTAANTAPRPRAPPPADGAAAADGAAGDDARAAELALAAEGAAGDDATALTDATTGRSLFVRYSGPQTFLVASGAADGADAVRGSEVYRFELKWQEVARLYKNILFDKATPSPPRMLDDLARGLRARARADPGRAPRDVARSRPTSVAARPERAERARPVRPAGPRSSGVAGPARATGRPRRRRRRARPSARTRRS